MHHLARLVLQARLESAGGLVCAVRAYLIGRTGLAVGVRHDVVRRPFLRAHSYNLLASIFLSHQVLLLLLLLLVQNLLLRGLSYATHAVYVRQIYLLRVVRVGCSLRL